MASSINMIEYKYYIDIYDDSCVRVKKSIIEDRTRRSIEGDHYSLGEKSWNGDCSYGRCTFQAYYKEITQTEFMAILI